MYLGINFVHFEAILFAWKNCLEFSRCHITASTHIPNRLRDLTIALLRVRPGCRGCSPGSRPHRPPPRTKRRPPPRLPRKTRTIRGWSRSRRPPRSGVRWSCKAIKSSYISISIINFALVIGLKLHIYKSCVYLNQKRNFIACKKVDPMHLKW